MSNEENYKNQMWNGSKPADEWVPSYLVIPALAANEIMSKAIKDAREEEKKNRNTPKMDKYISDCAFNEGFLRGCQETKEKIYDEINWDMTILVNNLRDDLKLDTQKGEEGYKDCKSSYYAIKKYTEKIVYRLVNKWKLKRKELSCPKEKKEVKKGCGKPIGFVETYEDSEEGDYMLCGEADLCGLCKNESCPENNYQSHQNIQGRYLTFDQKTNNELGSGDSSQVSHLRSLGDDDRKGLCKNCGFIKEIHPLMDCKKFEVEELHQSEEYRKGLCKCRCKREEHLSGNGYTVDGTKPLISICANPYHKCYKFEEVKE